ncbi:MAG: biopolymer transporter ExbD, partial [Planctomycetales bacterium]|nr:biopolymer transporter ExbD [Planctomycetales bacterium]
LDVVLPSASAAVPLTAVPTELFVNIDESGRYFVDGRFIDSDEVRTILEQAVANNPVNQSVIIRADERVPFRSVVTIMDICNQTGVYDYSVTTKGEG